MRRYAASGSSGGSLLARVPKAGVAPPGAARAADLGEAPGLLGGPGAGRQKACAARFNSRPDAAALRPAFAQADLAGWRSLFYVVGGGHIDALGADQDDPLFSRVAARQDWGRVQSGVGRGAREVASA